MANSKPDVLSITNRVNPMTGESQQMISRVFGTEKTQVINVPDETLNEPDLELVIDTNDKFRVQNFLHYQSFLSSETRTPRLETERIEHYRNSYHLDKYTVIQHELKPTIIIVKKRPSYFLNKEDTNYGIIRISEINMIYSYLNKGKFYSTDNAISRSERKKLATDNLEKVRKDILQHYFSDDETKLSFKNLKKILQEIINWLPSKKNRLDRFITHFKIDEKTNVWVLEERVKELSTFVKRAQRGVKLAMISWSVFYTYLRGYSKVQNLYEDGMFFHVDSYLVLNLFVSYVNHYLIEKHTFNKLFDKNFSLDVGNTVRKKQFTKSIEEKWKEVTKKNARMGQEIEVQSAYLEARQVCRSEEAKLNKHKKLMRSEKSKKVKTISNSRDRAMKYDMCYSGSNEIEPIIFRKKSVEMETKCVHNGNTVLACSDISLVTTFVKYMSMSNIEPQAFRFRDHFNFNYLNYFLTNYVDPPDLNVARSLKLQGCSSSLLFIIVNLYKKEYRVAAEHCVTLLASTILIQQVGNLTKDFLAFLTSIPMIHDVFEWLYNTITRKKTVSLFEMIDDEILTFEINGISFVSNELTQHFNDMLNVDYDDYIDVYIDGWKVGTCKGEFSYADDPELYTLISSRAINTGVGFVMSLTHLICLTTLCTRLYLIPKVETQSPRSYMSNLVPLLGSLLGMKEDMTGELKHDVALLNGMSSLFKTSKNVLDYVLSAMNYVVEYTLSKYFDCYMGDAKRQKFRQRVVMFIKDIQQLDTTNIIPLIPINHTILGRVLNLKKEGDAISLEMIDHVFPATFTNLFCQNHLKITKFHTENVGYSRVGLNTPEAVTVHFEGPPGSGKTRLTEAIIISLCKKNGTSYNPENVYNRIPENEYWEGYNGQEYVRLDDTTQSIDPTIRGQEVLSYIRMVNSAPYNLNMAFGGKGKIDFTSDIIISNSNHMPHSAQNAQIEDLGAYQRRIRFHYRITAKNKDASMHSDVFDPERYHIEQIGSCGKKMSRVVTFRIMIEEIHQARKSNKLNNETFFKSFIEDDEYFKADPIPRYCEAKREVETQGYKMTILTTAVQVSVTHCMLELSTMLAPPGSFILTDAFTVYRTFVACFQISKGISPMLYEYFMEEKIQEGGNPEKVEHVDELDQENLETNQTESFSRRENRNGTNASVKSKLKADNGRHKLVKVQTRDVRTEGSNDPNALNYAYKSLTESMCILIFTINGIPLPKMYGVFTNSTTMTFPAHVFRKTDLDQKIHCEIQTRQNTGFYEIAPSTLKVDFDRDLAMMTNPSGMTPHRSIYKKLFLNKNTMPDLENWTAVMFGFEDDVKNTCVQNIVIESVIPDFSYFNDEGVKVTLPQSACYKAQTDRGSCGRVIMLMNSSIPPTIVGFHVAGTKDKAKGFCNFLFQDDIPVPMYEPPDVPITDIVVNGILSEIVDVKGLVHTEDSVRLPCKSKIKQSFLYEWAGPSIDGVAQLKGLTLCGDTPYIKALRNWSPVPRTCSLRITMRIRTSGIYLRQHLFPIINSMPVARRILRLDEAITSEGLLNSSSINMQTSVGWPYVLARTQKGKSDFIRVDAETGEVYISEMLQEHIELRIERCRRGQRTCTVWTDSLKDERRPLDKCVEGKTRIFVTCPIDFLIVVRMYFGAFIDALADACTQSPIAIGINVHSHQWRQLLTRLTGTYGSKTRVIAGDYKSFDTSIPFEVIMEMVDIVNDWYNDEHSVVRKVLVLEMAQAVRLYGDTLFEVSQGNPSGNPITGIYNSLCGLIVKGACIIDIQGAENNPFDEYPMTVYGDDDIIATPIDSKLSYLKMTNAHRDLFGMVYTHFSKKLLKDSFPNDMIQNIRFLKRKFETREGYTFAPLPLEEITEISYWYKEGDIESIAIMSNLTSMLRELAHHDVKVTEPLEEKLLNILHERRIDTKKLPRVKDVVQEMTCINLY